MRNKKAKALRRMAENFAAMEGKPLATDYELWKNLDSQGQLTGYSVVMQDCARRVYKALKARYKQTTW